MKTTKTEKKTIVADCVCVSKTMFELCRTSNINQQVKINKWKRDQMLLSSRTHLRHQQQLISCLITSIINLDVIQECLEVNGS